MANYYENVLSFLQAHHDGEEEVVFPLLRTRCPEQCALVDELAEQHEEALPLAGPGNGWRRGPVVATRCSSKWWARWGRCGRT